jgi:tetratricopeptide (TPR) repeat protein
MIPRKLLFIFMLGVCMKDAKSYTLKVADLKTPVSQENLLGMEMRSSFDQFLAAHSAAIIEDVYLTKVFHSMLEPSYSSKEGAFSFSSLREIGDANMKVEWKTRFPDRFPPLTFADLRDVTQAPLLDTGLWNLVSHNYKFLFEDSERFKQFKLEIKNFIQTKPALENPSLRHAEWWKIFKKNEVPNMDLVAHQTADDIPLLFAMALFEAGLNLSGELRVRNWLEARLHLSSRVSSQQYLPAFDKVSIQRLTAEYQNNPLLLVKVIEQAIGINLRDFGVLVFVEQKTSWLAALREEWTRQKKYMAAATASRTRLALLKSSNKEVLQEDFLLAGNLWIEAGDFDRALSAFAEALEISQTPWERGLAFKGLGVASMAKSTKSVKTRQRYQEWAIEYFRRSLLDLAQTSERDSLLNLYAEALSVMGYSEAVADVYESIFRGGSSEESQMGGLLKLLSSLHELVVSSQAQPGAVSHAKRYASLLSAFARAHPSRLEISSLYAQALKHRKILKLEQDLAYQATLFEVENILLQNTKLHSPSSRRNSKTAKPKKNRNSGGTKGAL